ncbi:DMT family transporter [Thermodesulfobacteriota bacterium]
MEELIITRNSSSIKGLGFMLIAAFLFAVMVLLIKILGPSFRVWDIAMYRLGGGTILLLTIFGWNRQLFRPHRPRLLLLRGMIGTMAFISITFAIRSIPLSTAMVFFYSFPAFAAVFAPLIFGDRISLKDVLCILAALIGVAVLFDFKMAGSLFGQIMALISAIFAGFTVALIRELRKTHGAVVIYFYFCLIGAIVSFGPYMVNPQIPGHTRDWLIVVGILFTATGGQLLMNQGFRYCKSWEGGLFLSSELIFTSIFGILLLYEPATWRFWAGGLMILVSAAALNIKAPQPTQRVS